jgi:hypothetical protein
MGQEGVISHGGGNMKKEDWERVIRDAIAQSIWKTPPVDQEPIIRLFNWQVIESQGLRAVTRSGRVYVLEGPAGSHPDADWVLDRWLHPQGERRTDIRTVPLDEVSGRLAEQREKEGGSSQGFDP